MKILFIENRFKTDYWEQLADCVGSDNEVEWIVQNPEFLPANGLIHQLVHSPQNIDNKIKINYQKIISSNRAINYFKVRSVKFIYSYAIQINDILNTSKPDLIIGESTMAHELICIELAKFYGVLYLHPTTTRYPTGRIVFNKYDTQRPFSGSGDALSDLEAAHMVKNIELRHVAPDYMRSKYNPTLIKRGRSNFRILRGYFRGEKFNTPNPFVKAKLNHALRKRIREWESLASETPFVEEGLIPILYALQMQPEANIDVWGNQYRDQVETIREIMECDPRIIVFVKANPKAKYELSEELIELLREPGRIVPLPFSMDMSAALRLCQLAVTVTGTIAIECAMSNYPVVCLGEMPVCDLANCIHGESVRQAIQEGIELIVDGRFPKLEVEERGSYLKYVTKRSFKGQIADGLGYENLLRDTGNQADSWRAIRSIVSDVASLS